MRSWMFVGAIVLSTILFGAVLFGAVGPLPMARAETPEKLVARLSDDDPDVRAKAEADLIELGEGVSVVVGELESLLLHDGPEEPRQPGDVRAQSSWVTHVAARVLVRAGTPGREAIERALRGQNPVAIVASAQAVATLDPAGARFVPALLDALEYEMNDDLRRMHFHPWQRWAGRVEPSVFGALRLMGPAAVAAVPHLRKRIEGARFERPAFNTLIRIVPDAEWLLPALEDAVLLSRTRLTHHDVYFLRPWLDDRGALALPLVERLIDDAHEMEPASAAFDLVAACGEPGEFILIRQLRRARSRHRTAAIIASMTGHDRRPAGAIEHVTNAWSRGRDSGAERVCAPWLALMGEKGELAAMEILAEAEWQRRAWRDIHGIAPEFAERVGRRWLARHLPRHPATWLEVPEPQRGHMASPLVGGTGGRRFRVMGDGHLVGLTVFTDLLNGEPIVRRVTPVVRSASGVRPTAYPTPGKAGRFRAESLARDGYAVGGAIVRGSTRLQGLALIFMKIDGDRLDTSDAYLSTWLGGAPPVGEKDPATVLWLGGDGRVITGIHGRHGADIDAFGLLGKE